jgi:hypothetical protein
MTIRTDGLGSFRKAAVENKFCIVDAAAVLKNARWIRFVQALGKILPIAKDISYHSL